jgi:hypothetical protein
MSESSLSAEDDLPVHNDAVAASLQTESQGRPKLDFRILLAITGLALLVNFAVFFLSIRTSMGFSIPNAENWQDFSLAYLPAVSAFKNGFLPYINFYYPYPPPFLYVLTLFSYLPLPSWSSALPLVIAEALTVVPVYLIASEFFSERHSILVSTLFVLAPTGLYYVDYMWLNPSLTTLFLMLSIYLLLRKHNDLSAVALGLAFGFKQTALFALPIMALIVWRRESSSLGGLRFLLLGGALCFLLSLPYIALTPTLYLESIVKFPQNLCNTTPNYCSIAAGTGSPITLNVSNMIISKWNVVASGVNNPVTLALPLFIFYLPASLAYTYAARVNDLTLVLLACFAILLYETHRAKWFDAQDSLKYILYGLLLVFALYPFYKYYIVGIVPILALLVRNRRDTAGFIAFNFILMLAPRYLSSWVLLVSLLWLFRAQFHRKYFTYGLAAATVLLVAFIPFVATSTVAFPYTTQALTPVCSNSGVLTINTGSSYTESCVLLPDSSINQTSYVQNPSGAYASGTVNSNSSLPFNVMVRENTNGALLLEKTAVTSMTSSFSLSFGDSYSLIITNDSDQNNTITISFVISLGQGSGSTAG